MSTRFPDCSTNIDTGSYRKHNILLNDHANGQKLDRLSSPIIFCNAAEMLYADHDLMFSNDNKH